MPEALRRPLPPSVFARLAEATRYVIAGVSPDTWFGPLQPLQPMAPPEVKGRQFDYPFGANLNYIPRADISISFAELRALADALPLLRAVIETRKDQIAGQSYAVRARAHADAPDASKAIDAVSAFLVRPDRRRSFADWLRMLVEDMLVIDAATIYPRYTRGGSLYSLDIIDGATIKPLIGEDGRAPEAPDPAYQQILHGVPAADFSADELLYLPRNLRAHRLYGLSPDALGRTRRRRDRQATSAGNHNFCPSPDFATDLASASGFAWRIARARTQLLFGRLSDQVARR